MGITDELRKWAEDNTMQDTVLTTYPPQHAVHGVLETLLRIADRIDAEHQKACDDAWDNGYESDYLGIEKWLTEHPQVMEQHGWVRGPLDADGEYIHIGDKVTLYDRCVYEVDAIYLHKDRVSVSYSGESGCGCDSADNFHHYHEPTVEDLLCEFAEKVIDSQIPSVHPSYEEAIAEYATKFRLADNGKEQ